MLWKRKHQQKIRVISIIVGVLVILGMVLLYSFPFLF
jgi:predicted nucleic acid-binding Zn ribbon protein